MSSRPRKTDSRSRGCRLNTAEVFFRGLSTLLFLSLLLPGTVSAQGPSGASSGGTGAQIQGAYRLYNEGDYRRAAEILEGLKDRGIIEAAEAALLSLSYLRMERMERAESAAEFASRLDPGDYLVLVARGNLALYEEDYPAADRLFRRARRIFPARPEAKNGIAAALAGESLGMMRGGEFASAADALSEACELQPKNPRLYATLIAALRETDREEALIEAYRRYLRLDTHGSGAADAHGGLGSLLLERGRREEALRHLRRAVDLDTEDPRPFIILGKIAAAADTDARRREARSLLQEGIGKAVRLYGMYRAEAARMIEESRGGGGTEGGSGAPSKEDLRGLKALSERAEEPKGLLEEALALLPKLYDDPGELIEELQRLSQWYPSSAEIRQSLAEALFRDGRRGDAERIWRELVERFPLHYEAHVGLGRTLAAADNYRAAAVSLRRALDVEPEKAAAYSELQSLYRRWGREEDLLSLLERRMLKDKYNPLLYSAAAETARHIGRLEKAGEYRRRAEMLIDGEL